MFEAFVSSKTAECKPIYGHLHNDSQLFHHSFEWNY